jgi:hypothetical protein
MKFSRKIFAVALFSLLPTLVYADKLTVGLGFGSLYNGIGANIGLVDKNSLRYFAAGCPGLSTWESRSSSGAGDVATSSSDSGIETNCGLGAGYAHTGLFGTGNNRHALGLGLGISDDRRESGIPDNGIETHLRLTYNYFPGGILKGGINLGLAPVLTVGVRNTTQGLLLNLGFQF